MCLRKYFDEKQKLSETARRQHVMVLRKWRTMNLKIEDSHMLIAINL